MPTLNFEEIVTKISTEKGLTHEEIEKKVKEKLNQLSDLISKDGAAHIVANELGVRVYETPSSTPKKVSIKELNPAFKNVELLVKVLKVNEIRNFKTSSREGRVANVLVGAMPIETGMPICFKIVSRILCAYSVVFIGILSNRINASSIEYISISGHNWLSVVITRFEMSPYNAKLDEKTCTWFLWHNRSIWK